MRNTLRLFVVLDVLSLIFLGVQSWDVIAHSSAFSTQTDGNKLNILLTGLMFCLILGSAYGLFFRKKAGYILYYIQFPFRLYLWIFTIGFITLLPEALGNYADAWFNILLRICFAFELIRLYITIRAHMNLNIL